MDQEQGSAEGLFSIFARMMKMRERIRHAFIGAFVGTLGIKVLGLSGVGRRRRDGRLSKSACYQALPVRGHESHPFLTHAGGSETSNCAGYRVGAARITIPSRDSTRRTENVQALHQTVSSLRLSVTNQQCYHPEGKGRGYASYHRTRKLPVPLRLHRYTVPLHSVYR